MSVKNIKITVFEFLLCHPTQIEIFGHGLFNTAVSVNIKIQNPVINLQSENCNSICHDTRKTG